MSESWKKCPLCETEMLIQEEHDSKWRVTQYEHKCPQGCYVEKYVHGFHKIVIGKTTWAWDRESIKKEIDKIQSEIKDVVATYIIRVNQKKENEYRKELGIE